MATWEQILTSGTPINKLSDVTETGSADGDILIWDSASNGGAGSFVTNVLQSTSNEIHIDNTTSSGYIYVGLDNTKVTIPSQFQLGDNIIRASDGASSITIDPSDDKITLAGDNLTFGSGGKIVDASTTITVHKTNIKLQGAGEVTGAMAVGGIATVNGGHVLVKAAADASATLSLFADDNSEAGDEWKVTAGNDDMLRFTNDKAGDGEHSTANEILYLKGHATKTSTKAVVSGKLDVEGDTITFGSGATVVNTDANTLTITEANTVLSGDLTVTGNDIKSSSATAITLSGDDVDVKGDLEVTGDTINFGTSGATIVNTNPELLTITEANVKVSGDFQVAGGDFAFSNAQPGQISVDTTAAGTDGKDLTIRAGSAPSGSADQSGGTLYLKSGGGDGTGTSTMEFHTKVSGTDATAKAMEIDASGDVVIANNLTVSGTTVTLDTEIIKLEDNAIVLNSNSTGAAESGNDGGIIVQRGSGNLGYDAALFWDESYAAVDRTGTNDLGGRWAVGRGNEDAGPPRTFTTPAVDTVGGYIVGVTESGGAPANDDLATGLGALHVNTSGTGSIFVRVA